MLKLVRHLLCTSLLPVALASASPAPTAVADQTTARVSSWSDAVIYFVLIDRFVDGDVSNDAGVDRTSKGAFHGGDLQGLIRRLDDIASLGVTAIWINPVVKNIPGFVTGAGFPDWAYHGYWADDFYAIDSRFGTEGDLRTLVDACHARGIKVLLDVVYNHAGYGAHYVTDPKTKDWFRTEERGTCGSDDITSCVAGLPDFKTELPEVDDFLMKAHIGLARRTGIDGFRLDTVKHVTHEFWKKHRQRVRQELGPAFFLLGEVWGGDAQVLDPWFAGDELDAGFDFSFQGSVLAFIQGRGRTVAFDRYLKSRESVRPGYQVAQFLSSHDVPGSLFQLDGDVTKFRLALVLEMTCAGIPVVYYGEEVGRRGGDWPDNRSDMPWGDRGVQPGAGQPRNEALRGDYQKLIAIRKAHSALTRGLHTALVTDGDCLVFRQTDSAAKDSVVVAVNRASAAAEVSFDPPAEWTGRAPVALFGEVDLKGDAGGRLKAKLPPLSAAVICVH